MIDGSRSKKIDRKLEIVQLHNVSRERFGNDSIERLMECRKCEEEAA